jgi:hypothetical protein
MIIPEYNLQVKFKPGDNVVEFTPQKTGRFPYSCWMGMIRSSITVVEAGTLDAAQAATTANAGDEERLPAGYEIPTDAVTVAQIRDGVQYVQVEIGLERFSPALVVMQKALDTQWDIAGVSKRDDISALLFPAYEAVVPFEAAGSGGAPPGTIRLYLNPEADFDFSTDDFGFYGYVKVVDDINNIDIEAIKKEAGAFETFIWDYTELASGSGGGCCARQ